MAAGGDGEHGEIAVEEVRNLAEFLSKTSLSKARRCPQFPIWPDPRPIRCFSPIAENRIRNMRVQRGY